MTKAKVETMQEEVERRGQPTMADVAKLAGLKPPYGATARKAAARMIG